MKCSLVSRWRWWACTAIAIHFTVFLLLGLSRHWGFLTSINDLGVFDQAVWGTRHGQFLLNTSQLNQPINWLGFHYHPVLLLFVPLYAIAPCPEWFTLAQALALSVAAWPVFLLASRVCESEKAGLLWAIAYLANPFLLNAAAWDFHPIALAVPFIALGLLAVEKADSRLLFFSCLPLLFIQEQLGLTVACFGFLWWLRNRRWKTAFFLIALGISHAALVLGFIMPALSPTGAHVMLENGTSQLSRYGWLGKSVSDIVLNLLLHPWSIAMKVLYDWSGWLYLTLLLLPLLGLPLAAPVYLLPALPDLAANLLSAIPMPRSIFSYHSVILVPILTIAAAYGVRRISQSWSWLSSAQISGLALIASLIMGYILAPLPIPGSVDFWAPAHFPIAPDPVPAAIRATLGNTSISVQGNIGAHFSQRGEIYSYPYKAKEVDAIVLRLESPTTRLQPQEPGKNASLAWHLQMSPTDYLASIHCLLASKTYGVLLWEDPWLVFAKGAPKGETEREIETQLILLRQQWGLNPGEETRTPTECNS